MKIAFLHSCFHVGGGAERQILWLARELNSRGHKPSVFATSFGLWAKALLEKEGIPYTQLDLKIASLNLAGFKVRFSGVLPNLENVPRRTLLQSPQKGILSAMGKKISLLCGAYDLVMTFNFPSYAWAYCAREFGDFPPTAWFCFEPPGTLYRDRVFPHLHPEKENPPQEVVEVEQEAARDPHLAFTTTNYIKQIAASIYGRSDFIPVYAGLPQFPEPGAESPYPFPYIFSVSRLYPEKNFDSLLRAFARLKTDRKLVIAGEGPEKENLEKLIAELNLGDRALLIGGVLDQQLINLYQHCDLVAFLPLDEPMGLVPIEAGFQGKAVIASNQGGPAEIVRNEETGLLVDPQDEKAIAEKIELLLSSPEKIRQLGENAVKHCRENYTISAFADRIESGLKVEGASK